MINLIEGYFIRQWKPQLEQISFILQYLHTYPKALSDLKIKDLITPQELYKQQEEWIWLYSKYKGMEKDFFRPYWIPIQRNGYDYFIDMSDSNFPIIEAFFEYFDEPYHWEKKILFESITTLMLSDEDKINLKQYRVDKIIEKYCKYLF
ncbi:hypothetical protein D0T56_15960 [Dysgonomonas sp. 520]|nr:hypothetical protein [Dysgonomonas sp. 520]